MQAPFLALARSSLVRVGTSSAEWQPSARSQRRPIIHDARCRSRSFARASGHQLL